MRYLILSALTELTGFKTRTQAAICIAAFLNISYLVIYPYGLCTLAVNVMSGDISACNFSEIRDERKFTHVCMLPLAGRVNILL